MEKTWGNSVPFNYEDLLRVQEEMGNGFSDEARRRIDINDAVANRMRNNLTAQVPPYIQSNPGAHNDPFASQFNSTDNSWTTYHEQEKTLDEVIQGILHLDKNVYERLLEKAARHEYYSLEDVVRNILIEYFEPTPSDDVATAMNKKLGFDKDLIPTINLEDDYIPF